MQEAWMSAALDLARQAGEANEVPVGAVVVIDDEIVGRGFNQPISRHDPTAHAEIEALRDAARRVGNYRLPGSTLIVTIEPCTMCAGALIHARVGHLIFGAREPRAGAVCSSATVLDNQQLNHQVEVTEGVLAEDCSRLMTEFFQSRRH
jgi:tRNA(adenine34) deaminase